MRQPFLFKIIFDAFDANFDACLHITGANDLDRVLRLPKSELHKETLLNQLKNLRPNSFHLKALLPIYKSWLKLIEKRNRLILNYETVSL